MSDNNVHYEENITMQPEQSRVSLTLEPERSANKLLGIAGALAGSFLGVALWVLIDRIGFIAGISGVVMLLASFKGYQILGGKLDRFGMIFGVVLSFVMIFVAVNLTLLMAFADELGWDMMRIIGVVNVLKMAWTEPDLLSYILKNLGVGYALYLWAGFSHIKNALKGQAA